MGKSMGKMPHMHMQLDADIGSESGSEGEMDFKDFKGGKEHGHSHSQVDVNAEVIADLDADAEIDADSEADIDASLDLDCELETLS